MIRRNIAKQFLSGNRALSFTLLVSVKKRHFFSLFALLFTQSKYQHKQLSKKYLHVHQEKHEKCLEPNTVTKTTSSFVIKMRHIRFFTSLNVVNYGYVGLWSNSQNDFVSSGFRCSLVFLLLFVASQDLAKPGNNANTTPVSSAATRHCNNVYNSFYAGPNKKIETILQEMKKQLTQLQDDFDILKGNKTTVKGKISVFSCSDFNSAKTSEDY